MLPSADKEQCGAFIVSVSESFLALIFLTTVQRDERVMVVWTDDFDTIIPLAREFEEKLIKLVWKNRLVFSAPNSAHQSLAATSSDVGLNEKTGSDSPEPTARDKSPKKTKWSFSWKLSSKKSASPKSEDPEKGIPECIPRRMRYFAPFYNGLGCALSLCKFFSDPTCPTG